MSHRYDSTSHTFRLIGNSHIGRAPPTPAQSGRARRDPITRLAFQMHDGCYIDHFPFDSIDDAIGKPLKKLAPESPFQDAPHGGMLLNLFEG